MNLPQSEICAVDKIRFTQDEGCLNDGSFEFCVTDERLTDIRTIVPQAACMRSAGRARCDIHSEYVCLVSTEGLCSPPAPLAMSEAGWQLICQIAEQPFIRQTRYE